MGKAGSRKINPRIPLVTCDVETWTHCDVGLIIKYLDLPSGWFLFSHWSIHHLDPFGSINEELSTGIGFSFFGGAIVIWEPLSKTDGLEMTQGFGHCTFGPCCYLSGGLKLSENLCKGPMKIDVSTAGFVSVLDGYLNDNWWLTTRILGPLVYSHMILGIPDPQSTSARSSASCSGWLWCGEDQVWPIILVFRKPETARYVGWQLAQCALSDANLLDSLDLNLHGLRDLWFSCASCGLRLSFTTRRCCGQWHDSPLEIERNVCESHVWVKSSQAKYCTVGIIFEL